MQTPTTTRDGSVIVSHTDSQISGRLVSLNLFTGRHSNTYIALTQQEALQIGEALVRHAKAPVAVVPAVEVAA